MYRRLFFAWVASFITFFGLEKGSVHMAEKFEDSDFTTSVHFNWYSPVISSVVTCTVRGSGTGSLLRSTFHSPQE